ncbi:serine hydrolase [Alkaliphilus peptidifermentans]|uniref:Beta-lactamase class A n=1 Tax=Alkaliphilus peptidifermentans DSM 18978 TaxID=1120976 RepID=A0A1G5IV08_9FIRM|nr:serine hydrolase [Alkaliphilus peptidifermentans]SCY79912.1 beta-lactamase class A [Alkaliphilus peptidifermentans DSM 18978]
MKELQDIIQKHINEIEGTAAIYVKDTETNEVITINSQERFHAASTIKIPILWEALRQVEKGSIKLDDKILLKDVDKVGGCGVLFLLHNGLQLTLEDLLHLMIDISDNTATNMVIDFIGKDNVNKALEELGMVDTFLARKLMVVIPGVYSYTCAKDIGRILEAFITHEGLHKEYAEKGLAILEAQQLNNRLSQELHLCGQCEFRVGHDNTCPQCGASIADVDSKPLHFPHKTGEIIGVTHDAGIMHIKSKRIIVVALTKGLKNNKIGYNLLSDIGLEIYDYFNNR